MLCLNQDVFCAQERQALRGGPPAPFGGQVLLGYMQMQEVCQRMIDSAGGGTSMVFPM